MVTLSTEPESMCISVCVCVCAHVCVCLCARVCVCNAVTPTAPDLNPVEVDFCQILYCEEVYCCPPVSDVTNTTVDRQHSPDDSSLTGITNHTHNSHMLPSNVYADKPHTCTCSKRTQTAKHACFSDAHMCHLYLAEKRKSKLSDSLKDARDCKLL